MVDVRELRIGNFFKISVCDNFRVDEIYKNEDGFYCVKNNIGCNGSYLYGVVEDLQPISLTEELLLKCGMNECDDVSIVRYAKRNGKFKINIMLYELKKCVICINNAESGEQVCSREVKYLHQLQNIYFDFTGKKLEVNL